MGRKFAFLTSICLLVMVAMGIFAPDDPLFLFAAKGPVALAFRIGLAFAMLVLAFGPAIRKEKYRSYLGLAGFGLIVFSVAVLSATQGSGIYPYLQPADMLSALVVGITASVIALEAIPAATAVVPDNYYFYQELQDKSGNRKNIKTSPSQKPA
jgi:hypothetical protein